MRDGAIDYGRFEALTFDCYGTLIDWENGILRAVRRAFEPFHIEPSASEILEAYADVESTIEGGAYQKYRNVLAQCAAGLCRRFAVPLRDEEPAFLTSSLQEWAPFPDTVPALNLLRQHFKLAVISNIDRDLFEASNQKLGEPFSWIITADEVGSYKPSPRNFEYALARIGHPKEEMLHVAQSLYHDHAPASALGIASVWINRRAGQTGHGATPAADAQPGAIFPDMRSFADAAIRN